MADVPPPAGAPPADAADAAGAVGAVGRGRAGVWLRRLIGLAGAGFLAVAFAATAGDADLALPPTAVAGAFACVLGSLACALPAWTALVGGVPARRLAPGFYLAQLGKYVPGAVWQAVGQVTDAVAAGAGSRDPITVGRATVAFGAFAVTQATAGAAVGATAALLVPDLAWPLRAGAGAAVALCLLLDRRWVVRVVARLRRSLPPERVQALVPGQRQLLAAWAWGLATMVLHGAAFAVLLAGVTGTGVRPAAAAAQALAWTAGFLALPVPAGLGVREGVLLALLAPTTPVAALVAASVLLRLVSMAAEALAAAVSRALAWRAA